MNSYATRSAYNSLWLQRDKLKKIIRKYGWSIEWLHPPFPHKGISNKRLLSLNANPWELYSVEEAEPERRPSPLRQVHFPSVNMGNGIEIG